MKFFSRIKLRYGKLIIVKYTTKDFFVKKKKVNLNISFFPKRISLLFWNFIITKTNGVRKMKIIKSRGPEIFDIELEKDLLAKNRNLAKENKRRFDRSDILAIDIMGSIGSGKTSLIKAILK